MEIKCKFGSFFLDKSDYSCIVKKITLEQTIKEVKGEHKAGKSNADVTKLASNLSHLEHFPRGLTNHFPNLVELYVCNSKIKEISSQDLEGLEKLKGFLMQKGILTSLPDDLFQNTPNLEWISFAENKIELTSSNFLKPFVEKSKFAVNLSRNKNIDAWYDSAERNKLHPNYQKSSLEELMKTIDENCIKPQKPRNFVVKDEKFKDLWNSGLFSDLKIISSGTEFNVHRNILAMYCPKLAEIIEKDTKELKINGFSPDAVKSMLHFIYTNEILLENNSQDNANENLTIAHKFKMQDMKSVYEEIIANKLNDSNAYETFLLAHQSEAKDLKQKAINLIAKKLAPLPMSFAEDPIKLKKLIDFRSEYEKLLEEQ